MLQGKFAKDWRKLNGVQNRKLKAIFRQKEKLQKEQEKLREAQEKEWDLYWDPTRPTKKKRKKGVPQKTQKQKGDVFQLVFKGIILIIRELWLERNTNCHRLLQGQQRIARISEATQTVADLYSLRTMIMPQHKSRYFTISLEECITSV